MKFFLAIFLLLISYNYIFLISECKPSEITQIGYSGEQQETEIANFSIRMPGVRPTQNNAYFCMEMKVESPMFIVDYQIIHDIFKPHHIILFGIEKSFYDVIPERIIEITGNKITNRSTVVPCDAFDANLYSNTGDILHKFILGWTPMSPTEVTIPEGFGFEIGGNSKVNYLYMEVHYSNVEQFSNDPSWKDNSGIIVSYVPQSSSNVKPLEILYLNLKGTVEIPAMSIKNIEYICSFDKDDAFQMLPLSYVIHTHSLGVFFEGYKVSRDKNNETNFIWELIGDGNLQSVKDRLLPVKNEMVIENDDFIAVRCTMNNYLTHPVVAGRPDWVEACDFMLFFSFGMNDSLLKKLECSDISQRGWLDQFKSIP